MTKPLRTRVQARTLVTPLLAGVAALALFTMASTALAAKLSMADAERIALQHYPNASVEGVERDFELNVEVYEVELIDRGVEYELVLDANDGHVIRTEVD